MNAPARPAVWNRDPLPHVRRVIAVASGKGGVGKSTVTVNLAHALAALGHRVGILDADIYGPSIPRMLGLETRLKPEIVDNRMIPPIAHGIKAMSMALITGDNAAVLRAPMITKTLTQFLRVTSWGAADAPLDYLLIDMPPGTGDVTISLAQAAPLDGVLLVTTPQDVAVIDADKCAQAFTKLGVPILGVIENMSSFAGAHPFGQGGGQKLATQYNIPLIAELPLDPAITTAADHGENYVSTHSASEATTLFTRIAKCLK